MRTPSKIRRQHLRHRTLLQCVDILNAFHILNALEKWRWRRSGGAGEMDAQQLVDENYVSAQDVVNVLLGSGRNDVETTTEFLLDYLQNRSDRENTPTTTRTTS